MSRNHFGEQLAYIRKRKGLSQQDLATKAGLTKRAIAYYELQESIDFVDKIERLIQALNISANELFTKEEKACYQKGEPDELAALNPRVTKKLKNLLKLNKADRAKIYEQIDLLLQKEEYSKK